MVKRLGGSVAANYLDRVTHILAGGCRAGHIQQSPFACASACFVPWRVGDACSGVPAALTACLPALAAAGREDKRIEVHKAKDRHVLHISGLPVAASYNRHARSAFAAGREDKRIEVHKAKDRDVLHISWLLECERQKARVPLRPRFYLHISRASLRVRLVCGGVEDCRPGCLGAACCCCPAWQGLYFRYKKKCKYPGDVELYMLVSGLGLIAGD